MADGRSSSGSASASNAVQVVGAVLGVLGTGVGFLALVTFFGGIKMLARFRAVDLPGTEGVANMSRGSLVAVGTDELAVVTLVSVGVVLALWCAATVGGARREWWRRRPLAAFGGAVLLATLVSATLYEWKSDWSSPSPFALVLMTAAVTLGVAAAMLADRAGRGAVALALMFTASMVVGALLSYWSNVADPELRPAAVLQKGDVLVTGVWIAQSGGWFYLGEYKDEEDEDTHRNCIVALPADQVSAFVIGEYVDPEDVNGLADELGKELRSSQRAR